MELGWFRSEHPWWHEHPEGLGVTDSFPAEDALSRSLPRVVLLSSKDGYVDGVALARKAGYADTFRRRIYFDEWKKFTPFDIWLALQDLGGPTRVAASRAVSSRVGRFTRTATEHLLEWLSEHGEEAAAAIRNLAYREVPEWLQKVDSVDAHSYANQLDGLKVGLGIAGIDRAAALETLQHPDQPDDLRLDRVTNLYEDQVVNRDVHEFPDWLPQTTAFGAEFEDPVTGRRLQTFLANKLPLEKRTGADIIYFVEEFNSFVLVQYKRCRVESKGPPVYRPDSQLKSELKRMTALESVSPDKSGKPSELRLGGSFCFTKLCDPRQPLEPGLSVGMYFDLRYFPSVATLGERGGFRIVYGEVSRYVTNTTFSDLVAHGWVGSSGEQSEAVIEAMEGGLAENRSVLLASIRLGDDRRGRSSGHVRARVLARP
ncbi:hypothetical protein [Phytoactinopolyspora endophytica]|uniref:hypothetical protein n=1 Tax=Phytoactinopolyspora endophytica TaxID=1642495 RepID=UPI00101DA062|nr:hypothetical protein [Phytoactinopolyspora endophytica]